MIAPVELGDKAGQFQDSSIKAMTYNGAVYGVPYAIENIALLRNTSIVDSKAATLDEVVANGKKAVADGKATFPPFLVGMDETGRSVPPVPAAVLHGLTGLR